MFIDHITSKRSSDYLNKYIILDKKDDFSFYSVILKYLKYSYNLMSASDFIIIKFFMMTEAFYLLNFLLIIMVTFLWILYFLVCIALLVKIISIKVFMILLSPD